MFYWLSQKFRDFRIAWDRMGYERSEREAHEEEAERRFTTTAIELRAEELMVPYLREDRARFGEAVATLEGDARELRLKRSTEQYQLSLLKRDFASELTPVYRRLDELKGQRRKKVEEHQEVLTELRDVKSDIEWWYRKSKCYVFDRGRPIPQRRIFGADKSDLEWMKSKKEELREDLNDISSDIDEINVKISSTKERIDALKAERDRALRLKRDGASIFSLSHSIALTGKAIASNESETTRLKTERTLFLANARTVSGAQTLLDELEALRAQKVAFLEEFDCPKAREARIVAHRRQWLEARTG